MLNPVLKEDFDFILGRVTPRFKELAGRDLLITGAAGFVGSYLMDLLTYANQCYFERPVKVIGLDNWVAASRAPAQSEHVKLTRNLFDYRVDYCIHAASIASPKLYLAKPLETLEANVNLTRRVLEWSTAAAAVLYLSTSEVYGATPVVPTPEGDWGHASFASDRAVYHESKRYAELLCHVYHQRFAVPVKVARPFYIYGPGESLDDGRLVPQLIKAALAGSEFPIYGDGWATRSLCYVSDAVEQLFAVLLDGQPGEPYNVGSTEEVSIFEFAWRVGKRLFPQLRVGEVPDHPVTVDAPNRRLPDLRRVLRLAQPPAIDLQRGLQRTYRYYQELRSD